MGAPDLVNLTSLIDDAKCFALVRQHRWPEGVRCPGCGSAAVVRHGMAYADPGASYYEERYKQRVLANLRRRAKSLGYVLQATDSTPSVAEVS